MTQRFNGFIHSIIGHDMMVSVTNRLGDQHLCSINDFKSIMPTEEGSYAFHVKPDRVGIEHYRNWLGLSKIESDRLDNIESAMMKLIEMYDGRARATPRPIDQEQFDQMHETVLAGLNKEPAGFSPEEFATHLMSLREHA